LFNQDKKLDSIDMNQQIKTEDPASVGLNISDKEAWIKFACAALSEIDDNDLINEEKVIKKATRIADKMLAQLKERRF